MAEKGKPSALMAPDFTEDERKWIGQHPVWRVVFMLLRLALVPAMLAAITGYFEYKTRTNDAKTEAAYKTVAPVVDNTQEELKNLQKEVDLLRTLVVALAQGKSTNPTPTAYNLDGEPAQRRFPEERTATLVKGAEDAYKAAQARKDIVAVACMKDKIAKLKAVNAEAQDIAETTRRRPYDIELRGIAAEVSQCLGVDASIKPTVEQLQKVAKPAFAPRPLPPSAGDALQQMAK